MLDEPRLWHFYETDEYAVICERGTAGDVADWPVVAKFYTDADKVRAVVEAHNRAVSVRAVVAATRDVLDASTEKGLRERVAALEAVAHSHQGYVSGMTRGTRLPGPPPPTPPLVQAFP